MRALAVLVLAPAFALGAVAGAIGLVGGNVKVEKQPATSLVWADRVFVNQYDLAKWLESRGATYETWAAHHPSAAQLFEDGAERRAAAASAGPVKSHAAATDRSKPLRAGLAAGIALVALLGLFALRDHRRPFTRARTSRRPRARASRRPARAPVARPQLHPLTNVGQLSASIRRHGQSAFASVSPHLTALASSAGTRRARLLEDLRDPFVRRRIRHYLPRIAFYVISAICALVLGASVAIYFQ